MQAIQHNLSGLKETCEQYQSYELYVANLTGLIVRISLNRIVKSH